MDGYMPSEKDWKLYRQRLQVWQENHMRRLCAEYAQILTGENAGSEAFWEIDRRIRQDKKSPGVIADIRRSNMLIILLMLIKDGIIKESDLEGFSQDLLDALSFLRRRS